MGAERIRSAPADIAQHLQLLVRDHVAPALKELALMSMEDIGHFEPGPGQAHLLAGVGSRCPVMRFCCLPEQFG
jgi:hypothetical protein